MDTLEKVRSVICKEREMPLDSVTADARLEDLGDSLDLVEVVFALEEAFGVDIPVNAQDFNEKLKTVADVGDTIDRLLAAKDVAG